LIINNFSIDEQKFIKCCLKPSWPHIIMLMSLKVREVIFLLNKITHFSECRTIIYERNSDEFLKTRDSFLMAHLHEVSLCSFTVITIVKWECNSGHYGFSYIAIDSRATTIVDSTCLSRRNNIKKHKKKKKKFSSGKKSSSNSTKDLALNWRALHSLAIPIFSIYKNYIREVFISLGKERAKALSDSEGKYREI